MWGATVNAGQVVGRSTISIHAPRGGSDGSIGAQHSAHNNFNPRSPCGERLPAPRILLKSRISIHAPRVGSDLSGGFPFLRYPYFNPRSPCGEQQFPALYVCLILGFQSTLLVWGATSWCTRRGALPGDFNPRSPCGERPVCAGCSKILFDFNPRSPCGERHEAVEMVTERMEFQSTLPVWGATLCTLPVVKIAVISIHAPRVGSDTLFLP